MRENSNGVKSKHPLKALLLVLLILQPVFLVSQDNTIKVGWFPQPSFIEQEQYENPSGYVQVYLEHIAQYTGWNYEFVKGDFEVLYKQLTEGKIDILPCLFYTEERDEILDFSESEMGTIYSTLFVRSDSPLSSNDPLSYEGITVAAEKDENPVKLLKFAKENSFTVHIRYYPSLKDVIDAVISGETEAGVTAGYQDTDTTHTILRFAPSRIYFAVPQSRKEIILNLNRAMTELKIVNPFFDRDLMSRFMPQFFPKFDLSADEKQMIANSRALTVAISNTWYPFEFYDKPKNEVSGLVIDIYRRVEELTGLRFSFVEEAKLANPTTDIIASFPHNMEPAQEAGYNISEPYLSFPLLVVSKKGLDISQGRTAIIKGLFPYHDFKVFDNWNPVRYNTHEECLDAVLKGEADQVLLNSYSASFILKKSKYRSLHSSILYDTAFEVCTAINKNLDPRFFYIINKALTQITRAESKDLIIKNTIKTNEISLRSIIDQMPLDVILLFVLITSILVIIIILLSAKTLRRNLETEKNKQLMVALAAAEKANAAKGQFTSRISHEIRSPLNAVIGYMNIAKSVSSENSKVNDCLTKAEYAAKHLLSILNDVLDMSSIESGKIHISHVPFNIREVITSLTMLFYSQAKQKGVELTVQLNGIESEMLVGDQLRLSQVLANLLSNAVKFTPKGGNITFIISEEFTSNESIHVRFVVQDTGIGMKKEFLDRIFKPFEQQDGNISLHYGGSGLGLSISKNLTALMNGAIHVESTEGYGSTFTVTFPFGIYKSVRKSGSRDFSSLKALVIHNDSLTRDYIKQLLENCGISYVKAHTIQDAYTAIQESHTNNSLFDFCIYDVNDFSEEDVEIISRIRKTEGSGLLIIAVSAYEHTKYEQEGLAAGVNKFISKPLFRSTMFNVLLEIFGSYSPKNQSETAVPSFEGKRILLAEDNEMNTEIAVEILKRYNIETYCVQNGKDAVEVFNKSEDKEFDAILMDIQMPILDGYEAAKQIRNTAHPRAKTIPIIAMTANAFAEDISMSLSSGMNNHISKPIDIHELIQTLSLYFLDS